MAELTPTQLRAIAALLSSRTHGEAAERARVSERQLYRWLQDETFHLQLERAEAELLQEATRRLSGLLNTAIDKLEMLLDTEDLSASDKLRVVRTVLELYPRLREVATFESRLEALERSIEDAH